VLRRFEDRPEKLGDLWTMRKGAMTLVCTLATHSLGWELRLFVNGDFIRSQVAKAQTAVLDTSDAWRVEAVEKGWTNG
jgi:hypothetical protein